MLTARVSDCGLSLGRRLRVTSRFPTTSPFGHTQPFGRVDCAVTPQQGEAAREEGPHAVAHSEALRLVAHAWMHMHGGACVDARAWMRMRACACIYARAWMHACERTQRVAIAVEMDDSRCRSPRPPWQMEIKDGYGRSRLGPGREETPGLAPGSRCLCYVSLALSASRGMCSHGRGSSQALHRMSRLRGGGHSHRQATPHSGGLFLVGSGQGASA